MSAPDHVDEPLKLIPEVATESDTQRPDLENPPDDGWKHTGVQVVSGDQLDDKSPNQGSMATTGMMRAVAIDKARNGAQKLWAGTVKIKPNAATGAHHHGMYPSRSSSQNVTTFLLAIYGLRIVKRGAIEPASSF